MKDLVVRIYDFFSAHRWAAWATIALMAALSLLGISRMHYEEDISAFLPQDSLGMKYNSVYMKLGGQDRIAVFFTPRSECADTLGTVMDAMDAFERLWAETDTAGLVEDVHACTGGDEVFGVLDFISSGWPYYARAEDYARADSLLAQPGFIRERLASDRQALSSIASAVTSRYMRTDPLGLFTPVLRRLEALNPMSSDSMVDGYLFTRGRESGVLFFKSPFGGSESGRNAELAAIADRAGRGVEAEFPEIGVSATGGPLVAVGNASRIKKDSIISVSLALVLILLVLALSYRRLSDVVWIAVSLACGALFALGLTSIFKDSISIIVLGIGAMIIGIAVNYPLHYIDHLKYQPDKRAALREQVTPLLVGNLTTVGAFLGLLLMKSDALRDFGLVGALMLVGTILFVLLFLPVLARARSHKAENTLRLDFDRHLNPSPRLRKVSFALFLALTLVFFAASRRTSFDADMHHINYMTPDQAEGFARLEAMGEDRSGRDCIYAVCESSDADEVLRAAEALVRGIGSDNVAVSAIVDFVPSAQTQRERLALWRDFVLRHPSLEAEIRAEASRQGFAPAAFESFLRLLSAGASSDSNSPLQVRGIDYFEPLTTTIGQSMFLQGDGVYSVVSYVRTSPDDAPAVKTSISAVLPEGAFCFDSADVGSRLVDVLSADFENIGLVCSLIVFLFLWLSFGSLELSLMSFLPLAVGWVWILGIMQIFGLQFNIVNIVLATFIFGMGDDYTIFITEGLMYEHARGKKILTSYKNSVALSALIMFLGIGVLVIARHPAMRSVGLVTVVGMFTVVVMAYYLPPLVFRALTSRKGVLREVPLTFGRIWNSLLAILFFLGACLVFVPATVLIFAVGPVTESKKLRYHRFLQKLSAFIINHVPGTRFEWKNPFGEDFSTPAVFICNHQSHLDVMAAMMLTPKLVIMTNDWVWNNPFYGALIHRAEFYPASDGYDENFRRLQGLVARGYSVLVYPEGTRNPDCLGIQRFHRGAFMLAYQLGVDVLPLYIHGFGSVLPKRDFMLRRSRMYLEVGRRVPVSHSEFHLCHSERSEESPAAPDWKAVTRAFHALYVREYARIRAERETAAFWAPYVKYQYLYKGTDVAADCRRQLSRANLALIDTISRLRHSERLPRHSDPELVEGEESPIALPSGMTLISFAEGTLELSSCGVGAWTLVLALSCPDLRIVAHESDDDKRLIASRIRVLALAPSASSGSSSPSSRAALALPFNLSYLP